MAKPTNTPAPTPKQVTRWDAFALTERKTPEGEKTFWSRAGSAFLNRDGSWTIRLDVVPLSGQIQIREPKVETED